jgi:hypothetical protein
MERNIGAPNRRIPPDVRPKGSTSRDLDQEVEPENEAPDASDPAVLDPD